MGRPTNEERARRAALADAIDGGETDIDAEPETVITRPAEMPTPATDRVAALEAQIALLTSMIGAGGTQVQPLVVKTEASVRFPQNVDYNEKSPFTYPEGERDKPKPRLKRDTFFLGMRQRGDELTPTEVTLFNAFDKGVREARNGMWRAEVTMDGSREVLSITCADAMSIDGRQSLPPLVLILNELLNGHKASDPASMIEELATLKAQMHDLMAARA